MSTPTSDMGRADGGFDREPARRVFASEFRECRFKFKDSDVDKSPTFVLLPTGERSNRIFIVGTLTEKQQLERQQQGEKNILYRGRVIDPTGTFFIEAGNYQTEAMHQLSRIEAPAFVAVIGKPNLYQKQDGAFIISVKMESITVVDKEIRDLWVLDTAARTLDRIDAMATGSTPDIAKAKEVYPSIDPAAFRRMAYDALAQIKM
jgi:RPA family protein